MKNIFILLAGILALASCSSPKYTYHFGTYDYNSGKKKVDVAAEPIAPLSEVALAEVPETSNPLVITKESLTASASETVTPVAQSVFNPETMKKYTDLSRSEKKAFRKELKTELKKVLKQKKDDGKIGAESKALDYNLKMALIFGIVAVVLSLFGGANSVFWILSVVAIVVAVVFFIKWIAEQ